MNFLKYFFYLPIRFSIIFSKFCIFLIYIYNYSIGIVYLYDYWFFFSLNLFSIKFFFKKNYLSFMHRLSNLSKYNISLYHAKLNMYGLGYRIRCITSNLYKFFFTQVNFFYLHVPPTIILKIKIRKLFFIGRYLKDLRELLIHMFLLKKISVYRSRGFRYPRSLIFMKPGKKRF